MALVKKLTRIGNSTGLIFPQPVLDQMGLESGSDVELEISGKTLTVSPVRYATGHEFVDAKKRVLSKHRKSLERLAK